MYTFQYAFKLLVFDGSQAAEKCNAMLIGWDPRTVTIQLTVNKLNT